MRPLRLSLLLAFFSAITCGCNRVDKAPAPKDPQSDTEFVEPVILPGGVADDQGKVGYLANPKGGIDAVDLESGKLLWHSETASHPLLIYKDELLAQERHDVNPIRVVALSLGEKGKRLRASDSIELFDPPEPKDLDPKLKTSRMVAPDPKERPTYCRGSIRNGQIYLEWFATANDAALVNLLTGKVTSVRRESASGPARNLRYADIAKVAADPDALGSRNKIPRSLKKLDDPEPQRAFHIEENAQSKDSLGFRRRWVVADTLSAIVVSHYRDGRGTDFLLIGWDMKTGKNLHTVQVASYASHRDSGVNGTAFVGVADQGRYVVTRSVEEPGKLNEDGRRNWKPRNPPEYFVYSVKDGAQLHRLTPPKGYSVPCPVGPRVFYAVEGTLKAVDMATQKLLWERPIGGSSRRDWTDR